ncbi:SH3 domain-containing protein 19-like [Entelurus aequoreus]|uniref:SH3 domain-containing protein 19-like n=1 Tax=Entelurus aequoreus TaxID=161455 RepID=UPI002B1E1E09|nr:SH3 domain-containing protein 19-like [Entelurus aequoreus]
MAEVRRAAEWAGRPDLHLEEDHFHGNTAGCLHRRRPQIVVTSAQPVDADSRFSASSDVFPWSSPASWSAGIQVHAKPPPSFKQVFKEKTRENDVVQPKAAPRRTTQTHPVRGKKPQKPPRPSLPRPVVREQSGPRESEEKCCDRWSRSVTVHWSSPTTPTPSPPDLRPTPVPLPRIKSKRQPATEVKIQTLVQLDDVDSEVASGADAESSSKYLKELLEVFGEENPDVQSVEEAADGEMNGNHNQRNMQARIQAFESQTGPEDGNVAEPTKPQPLPRKTPKSPVSSKPPVAVRSQFNHSLDQDVQNVAREPPSPSTEFKPRLPQKPATGKPVHADLETLLAKGGPPYGSRPLLTKDYSIHEEEHPIPVPVLPPRSPVKSPKEPLKVNLNINNHNSTSNYSEMDYVESPSSSPAPGNLHRAESVSRPGVARRPTTIRVPSLTESLQGNAPPLPAQRPVGSLTSPSVPKQKSLPSMPVQASFTDKYAASPPTRAQSLRKTPPPRPPPAKPGPGRPPPPKTQTQKPSRRIPMLPPRPTPGQRLYNKYTLQLPHGIAASDFGGDAAGELSFQKNQVVLLLDEVNQDTFQCQVGNARGHVHKSRLQVITPLHADFHVTPSQASNVLKVQALHDFTPEGEGELALQAGDIISRVEKVDSEWYRGCLHNSTGFFPVSFVQVLSEASSERKPEVKVSGPRCVARFDFEGGSSEELTFSEGDVIQLKEYLDQEWARGQMGGHTGIFPLNFVQVLEHLPQQHRVLEHLPQQTTRIALPGMADPPRAEAVQPAQVANFDISQEWSSGRHNGREGIFPTAFMERIKTGFLGEQSEGDGGVQGKAMYDFTADCDEELSMQVGDVIDNLEVLDDDWFLGDLRGRRALVPRTYVQVI